MTTRKVLIDTDMGPGSAAATRWMLHHAGDSVVGLSATWGTHPVSRSLHLLEKALDDARCGDVPIVRGIGRASSSSEELVEFYRTKVDPQTVVLALGPLTNLAAVLPLLRRSEDVVVLGGSTATGVADSFRRDPLAAARVLSAALPLTVVMSGEINRRDLPLAGAAYAVNPDAAQQRASADVRVRHGRVVVGSGTGAVRIVTAVDTAAIRSMRAGAACIRETRGG